MASTMATLFSFEKWFNFYGPKIQLKVIQETESYIQSFNLEFMKLAKGSFYISNEASTHIRSSISVTKLQGKNMKQNW